MFKIISIPPEVPAWMRDPLAHPAIAAMDGRTLGDLPFGLFRPPGEGRQADEGAARAPTPPAPR